MVISPSEAIGTGLAVLGSKDILNKLLGPTAEYFGEKAKGLVQKCDVNLNRIFEKATIKLGNNINRPGMVNSRVLKEIWEEGRFCEDELTSEYLGGVLASSRSQNGRDDRGVAYINYIKSLSVYQLRLHYLFYHEFHKNFSGPSKYRMDFDREEMSLYIPLSVYKEAMEFNKEEVAEIDNIVRHSLIGLENHRLLGVIASSLLGFNKIYHSDVGEEAIGLIPTLMGAELYMWGMGIKSGTGEYLNEIKFKHDVPIIPINDGVKPVRKPRV